MGCWLIQLTANILAFLLLKVKFLSLRSTEIVEFIYNCFKKVIN